MKTKRKEVEKRHVHYVVKNFGYMTSINVLQDTVLIARNVHEKRRERNTPGTEKFLMVVSCTNP